MSAILLATLNARYIHASLGLRYLLANMGELRPRTALLEFTIDQRPLDIVEHLLARDPAIIGLGVYIWNVEQTAQVAALIKRLRPDIVIVLGGPEVSYEQADQPAVAAADYIISGQGDLAFAQLCRDVLNGAPPREKIIHAPRPALEQLTPPYDCYTDEDIAHRLIYVEASRGCPFKCEFCLSALDKTAWPFDLEKFLAEMAHLHARGARHFKFVDRTFNLNVKTGVRIMEFFLERLDEKLFLHFELVPDHLPEKLKETIQRFPPGSLQFEIGIQSFDPAVQSLISRKQDGDKTEKNLRWLRQHTHAHLHADLIAGLPGEDLDTFARGFDRLVALDPHEIQLGILKRLRGTPIIRHTEAFRMTYNPAPPYNILSTGRMDFTTLQRLNRFARYWDMIGNSGRFPRAKALLLGDAPFARFMRVSDWLYRTTGKTHQIALDRLFDLLYDALITELNIAAETAHDALAADYHANGARGAPRFLRPQTSTATNTRAANAPARQTRHVRTAQTRE